MNELIKITKDGVDARALYEFLSPGYTFRDWIRVSIRDYGFIEGKDFRFFLRESTGGRPAKEYALSIEMAKELSMVSKTKIGKQARRYFIKCEEIAKKLYATRIAGKMARRTLTDSIQDSGENERMHGHAYTTYTKLAYKLTGISTGSRDSLDSEDLKRLENAELLMKGLIEAGQTYNEIKDTLKPIFL